MGLSEATPPHQDIPFSSGSIHFDKRKGLGMTLSLKMRYNNMKYQLLERAINSPNIYPALFMTLVPLG